MKNSRKQFTKQSIPCPGNEVLAIRREHEPSGERFLIATALTGLLALTFLGTARAGDLTLSSRMMRPLYTVNFDVGRKHVLSYFLSKGDQCDLTVMVTEKPNDGSERNAIRPLSTSRFSTLINGGKSARFDTAEGRALEYDCEIGAQLMSVREVSQVASSAVSRR